MNKTLVLSSMRYIQSLVLLPALFCALLVLTLVKDSEFSCLFDTVCRQEYANDRWFDDLQTELIFILIGFLFFLGIFALIQILKVLFKRKLSKESIWTGQAVAPIDTREKIWVRLLSWVLSLALAIATWLLLVSLLRPSV